MIKKIFAVMLMVCMLAGLTAAAGCSSGSGQGGQSIPGGNVKPAETEAQSQDEGGLLLTQEDLKAISDKLDKIDDVLDKYYLNTDELTKEEMIEGIFAGYVNTVGDPYTVYYTPEEYDSVMEDMYGTYYGVGALLSQDPDTGIITIVKPFKGYSAEQAGIRKDDQLFKVGDMEVTGLDLSYVVTFVKGEEGTTVDVTVYRPSTEEYLDFTLTRTKVEVPTVEYEMLDNGIGYIQLTEFDDVSYQQVSDALADLQSQNMRGLIFDLRDNPGGLVSSVCDIADIFLPSGIIVYTQDKNGNGSTEYADDQEVLDIPMVILVNGSSASASEIFAGAMKDYKWATIVGTQTFGKGIVQMFYSLGDGSAMKVTVSKYFSPNGINIHGTGITPDIEIEDDLETTDVDEQMEKAVEEVERLIKQQ